LIHNPSPEAQANYLKNFRADSIVKDAEFVRRELLGDNQPWSVLGQSFGGFCALHYLSKVPHGLNEVIFTGGLPPIDRSVDDVYRATYRRVIQKNELYYQRYPDDVEKVHELVDYLNVNDIRLPGGGRLTPRRLRQLGFHFGSRDGFEQVHYLLEKAFVSGSKGKDISYTFLRGLENLQPFETNPIFAVLNEAIYCQEFASNWSADRILEEYPQFRIKKAKPVFFFGEMIFPWMFDDYERLRPLKPAANILAKYDAWPRLYDAAQLQENQVPCVAAVYYNDMYVERVFSEETAALIDGMNIWITNEHEHSALRLNGEKLLDHLMGMLLGDL
jgi:pimeloyl-ACP methyl ester carboxylesterase